MLGVAATSGGIWERESEREDRWAGDYGTITGIAWTRGVKWFGSFKIFVLHTYVQTSDEVYYMQTCMAPSRKCSVDNFKSSLKLLVYCCAWLNLQFRNEVMMVYNTDMTCWCTPLRAVHPYTILQSLSSFKRVPPASHWEGRERWYLQILLLNILFILRFRTQNSHWRWREQIKNEMKLSFCLNTKYIKYQPSLKSKKSLIKFKLKMEYSVSLSLNSPPIEGK